MKQNILLLFIVVLLSVGQIQSKPDADVIFQFDSYKQNLLFRGNNPCKNGKFQYDDLVEIMKQKTLAQNEIFPEDFELIVYSVYNSYINTKIEKKYFEKNPEKGKFIYNPLGYEPYEFPTEYSNYRQSYLGYHYPRWTKNHLGEVGESLRQELIFQGSKPRIVYLHCYSGIHVVHMGFGGYQLKIHNQPNKEILQWYNDRNLEFPGMPWQTGVSWYCIYQSLYYGKQTYDCLYNEQ